MPTSTCLASIGPVDSFYLNRPPYTVLGVEFCVCLKVCLETAPLEARLLMQTFQADGAQIARGQAWRDGRTSVIGHISSALSAPLSPAKEVMHEALHPALMHQPAVQVSGYVYFPAVHKQRAWSLMPVVLLYVGNVAFSLMSLQNLNIPMHNTLKRMTPVIVLLTKVTHALCHPLTQLWPSSS